MDMIAVDSKQIQFVGYDEKSGQMVIHYHTGEVKAYPSNRDDFQSLMQATNKYDEIVRMTSHFH